MKKSIFTAITLGGLCSCAQERPNFLIVETDDQAFNMINCLYDTQVETPNIDRLVRMGTTFTHAYNQGSWSAAVSVASRTMMITGQNMYNAPKNETYIPSWAHAKYAGEATDVPLWGEVFKEAGYLTFMTGKWHNTDSALLKCFTAGLAISQGSASDVSYHGISQRDRPNSNKEWSPSDKKYKGHWSPKVKDITTVNEELGLTPVYISDKHSSELYAETAIEFLRARPNTKSPPFFMFLSFQAPHDPRQSPKEYIEKYPQEEIKIPENFIPEHPFDQGDRRVRDECLASFPRTEESVKLHRQEYYAIITHMDKVIGDVLEALEQEGLLDNTYIVFTSDHGLAVGHHGLMGKQNQYDHTVRVPLIFAGPGIKKDVRTSAQVYLQSMYATTCDLAGIPIPETVDFPSVVPQLEDINKKGEESIYGGYRNLQRMLRTHEYKLIVYPKVEQVQLFDLKKDPEEMNNLAYRVEYKEIVSDMMSKLQKKQQELGDTLKISTQTNTN